MNVFKQLSALHLAIFFIAVLVGVAVWYTARIDQYSDIFFYQKMGADVAQVRAGATPGEPSVWYPPFAGVVFYGISIIPNIAFQDAWLIVVVFLIAAATAYVYWGLQKQYAYLIPLAFLLCALMIGADVTFARYDVLIGILVILAWQANIAKKYGISIAFALMAGGLKAVPLILVPIFLFAIPRNRLRSTYIGAVVGLLLVFGLPALILGPRNTLSETKAFVSYQSNRGFQVESTWSAADIFAKNLFNQHALLGYHHFATHNLELGSRVSRVSLGLLAIGLIATYLHCWRRGLLKPTYLAPYLLVTTAWTLLAAPVLSPQFLLWVFPLMIVWIGKRLCQKKESLQTMRMPIILLGLIALATQWIYPWHYVEFLQQTYFFHTLVINVRNLALLLLFIWCLRYIGMSFHLPVIFRNQWNKIVNFFTKQSPPLTHRQHYIAGWVIIAVAVGFVVYIGSFKMLDRDFWWHIKAGEIMTQTKQLITIEPFAHTRAGQPYLATQSWLSEILLYGIYSIGGVNGIIVFRALAMLAVFGLLLCIDTKRAWIYSILAIVGANAVQGSFMERPQLFTFMLFAAFLYLAFLVLEKGISKKISLLFVALAILWVNMHGAASLLGIGVVGLLALQYGYDMWIAKRSYTLSHVQPWIYLIVAMCIGFFVSPSGYHNVSYITQLLGDKTITFINEWQPRDIASYFGDTAILWIIAVAALWNTRKNWVYCAGLLLITGYLSRKALRHEVLFVLSAVAVTVYQLKYNAAFGRFVSYLTRRQLLAALLLVLSWFGLFVYTTRHYQNFVQQDQLYGYGSFTPAKGAYEFIEKNNITGNMFNTYGIGGYLLYRGYPDRKVYIDGRNVDYGFDFMNATYQAGLDGEHWDIIEDKYNVTYAIIDYMAIAKAGRLGYSVHLDKNPTWKLVYLDDWTGVYVKDIAANKDIIRNSTYTILNPINVEKGAVLDTVTPENKEKIIQELQRMIAGNADGIQGRLLLARMYIADGTYALASSLLEEVKTIQPHHADAYQLLGTIALSQQQWVEAADYYTQMLTRTGKAYPNINYPAIADVFAKAGHPLNAAWYRWLAKPEVTSQDPQNSEGQIMGNAKSLPSSGPITQDTISDLFAGIAQDLQKNNDDGVALAEQRKFSEAKEKFMEALKLDPGNPQTLNNLGVLSLQTENEKTALDYLKRALERTDEYPDAHYNLAIIYFRQQNYKEALKEAEKAQKYGRDSKTLIDAITAKVK